MGSIRIPRDELMSYTMGTFNMILKNMESDKASSSVSASEGVVTSAKIQGELQNTYIDSLTPEQLKELKEKHGVR